MDDRKSFFASLEPKSALIVGLVTGFLSLCTIGFFVLGFMMLRGTTSLASGALAQNNFPVDYGNGSPTAEVAPVVPTNIPKADKPTAELFVMSHCPYGLQMQKAYIPAWELLKKVANIDVKFVSYAMHEKQEIDENTLQYCIQKEQSDKYIAYLKCFTASGDTTGCLKSAGVNQGKATSCVNKANQQFGILNEYNDRSRWLSGQFPIYPIHQDLNDKYGVQGSPTLVINGVQIDGVARTPEAVKQAICAGFNKPPKECEQTLSNNQFQPGFGTQVGAVNTGGAGCGV